LLTEDGVWQNLLRRKYIGSKAGSQVNRKPEDSHFWAGIMATKKHFSYMVLSPLGMDHRLGFGRINGWDLPHFKNNILLYIILYVIKETPYLR
jgi:hypothetical protein